MKRSAENLVKLNCPNCKQETVWEKNPYRPFCSAACKGRDLGNWATERYRIAQEEPDDGATETKKDPEKE